MIQYRTIVTLASAAAMLGLVACGTDRPTRTQVQPHPGNGGASDDATDDGYTAGDGTAAGSGGGDGDALAAGDGDLGGDGDAVADGDTSGDGDASRDGEAANADCPTSAFAPGTAYEERSLTHDGRQRVYYVDVPASVDTARPSPMVIDLHGNQSSARREYGQTKLSELAVEEGFILITVEGVSSTWNSTARSGGTDDMGYLNAVIDEVQASVCVDSKRIYMTGMSLGAVTTSTYTCLHGEGLAGTAPVEGGLSYPGCELAEPLPIALFHGTDSFVNVDTVGASARDRWLALNGCSGEPEVTDYGNGSQCSEWTNCDPGGAVLFCVSQGMGHCWPGSACQLGSANMDVNANRVMWDFWQRHPTP